MSYERLTACHFCKNRITLKENLFNQYIFDPLFDLKVHSHYRLKHTARYLKVKGVYKRILFILLGSLLTILMLLLFLTTYPFWLVHEKLF